MRVDSFNNAISRGLLIIRSSSRTSSRFANLAPGAFSASLLLKNASREPGRSQGSAARARACAPARSGVPISTVSPRTVVKIVRPPSVETNASKSLRGTTRSIPDSCSAAGPGPSSGPSERSICGLLGGRYSVDVFVFPSIARIARGVATPVR